MKGLKLVLTVVVSLLLVGVAFADVPAMWKPVRGIALGDQPAITTARVFPDSLWVGTEHPSPAWGWWSKRSVNHGVTWPDSTLVIAGSGHGVPEFRWSEMRHNAKGVHFVMARTYQGQNLITYCRSTDGGMTWGYSRDVTTSGQYPGLAVDPWGVTVVWEYGNMIYARRGTYSGDTLIWNNPVRVDNPIRQDTVANFPQVVTGSDPEGFWSTYCAYRWTDPYHRGSLRVRRASVSGTGWTDVPRGIIKRCVKMGLGGGILMRDNLKRRESHHGRDRELLV